MSEYVPPRRYGERLEAHEPRFPSGVAWGTLTVAGLWMLHTTISTDTETLLAMVPDVLGTFLRNPIWFPIGALLGFFVMTVVVVTVVWVTLSILTAPVGFAVGSLLKNLDESLFEPQSPARGTLYWWAGFAAGSVLVFSVLGYSVPIAEFVGGEGAFGLGGKLGGFFGALFGWAFGITIGMSYGAAHVVDEWTYWKAWLVLELEFQSRLMPLSDAERNYYRREAELQDNEPNE